MKRFLLTILTGMFLVVSPAMAGNMPPGFWNFDITLDGQVQDQGSGQWPGYATTVVSDFIDVTQEEAGTNPWDPKKDRTFLGNVLMVSGETPHISIRGYTIHHNGYTPGSWDIEAESYYYFSVIKKVAWAPNIPVPLKGYGYLSMYVEGERHESQDNQHGATAYARVSIPGTAAHTIVEANADWTNPNPQPHAEVAFSLMPDTFNKAELYVHAYCFYGLESGYEDVSVIADPTIYVDWEAMVNVDGTDYYATQLYDVEFSSGFTGEVPEPSGITLGLLGLLGIGFFRRR